MPRTNIDYSKTIIYKICCKDLNIADIYVGHTTDFKKRKYCHKSNYYNINKKYDYNLKVYQFIRANGDWENWDMIEIEKYNAIDSYDAKKRERYWIEELKASLNARIPSRTQNEYYKDNIEDIKKYKSNYRENKKEFIAKQKKIFYETNKDKINQINKEYHEKNKNIINKKTKEYYDKNKDIINEKITCECGCKILKRCLRKHKQTKKHINLVSQLIKSSIMILNKAPEYLQITDK